MLLSIGLFLNIFILSILYNNLSNKFYLKTFIILILLEIINTIYFYS